MQTYVIRIYENWRTSIRNPVLAAVLITLTSMMAGCGGGGSHGSNPTTQDAPAPPTDDSADDPTDEPEDSEAPPTASSALVNLRTHIGSLYRSFEWSGPIRDPFRDVVEIHDLNNFEPIPQGSLSELELLINEREVIMQIGGMGSAKLNATNPLLVNESFASYMDTIKADAGDAWREAVTTRAREIAGLGAPLENLYWQIGNEINSESYSRNIHLYFDDGVSPSPADTSTIPTYVEYFLAPTIQALNDGVADGQELFQIALGSIATYANPFSETFLDTLLEYEIQGDFAPALAGKRVHELIDIITIHYLMNAASPEDPFLWRDVLDRAHEKWVGVSNIEGIWSTEEVGIQAASDGRGAAGSLRVMSRYLNWVSSSPRGENQARWFNYGASAGPTELRIDDAMSKVHDLVGEDALRIHQSYVSDDGILEWHLFYIPEKNAYLASVTTLSEEPIPLNEISFDISDERLTSQGWLYASDNFENVAASTASTGNTVTLMFDTAIYIAQPSVLLLWLEPS